MSLSLSCSFIVRVCSCLLFVGIFVLSWSENGQSLVIRLYDYIFQYFNQNQRIFGIYLLFSRVLFYWLNVMRGNSQNIFIVLDVSHFLFAPLPANLLLNVPCLTNKAIYYFLCIDSFIFTMWICTYCIQCDRFSLFDSFIFFSGPFAVH